MTTIAQTKIDSGNTRTLIVQWPGLALGDDGAPVPFSQYSDRSVQVGGTLGAGGTVRIEGSIDGVEYAPLTDPQGNALDITSAKIESITELVRFIRPRVTGGDGTTSATVTMILKE